MHAGGWVALRIRCVGAFGVALLLFAAFGCGRVGVGLLPEQAAACSGLGCACVDGSAPTGRGVCGCGEEADTPSDRDGDGVPDCVDACPNAPDRVDSSNCGCAAAEADEDGDGVRNCDDGCPRDGLKSEPGGCGCGLSDDDADGDGTADCDDGCPGDRGKSQPGLCGCGVSDADTDLDGDPDCTDECSGALDVTYSADAACGLGYCRSNNKPSTCVNGVETSCMPAAPLSIEDSVCNGVDDDCDGRVDEEYAAMPSSCGLGACMRTGDKTCSAGREVDSCFAGARPANDDRTCDGIDDDCDGNLDENVTSVVMMCPSGACVSMASEACVNGRLVDGCAADTATSSVDTTCDNVDDNCNGTADEGFVSHASSCGVGACMRSGMVTCSSGSVVDSCRPGTAAASDATCDGQDDDCDGRVDENYPIAVTSCGVGACAASGMRSCVSGSAADSCSAGTPATSVDDATSPGNGVDDDCDTRVDENVPACDTTPRTFEAGSHDLTVPGNCHSVTVRLWGGGGGGGQDDGLTRTSGGNGGPGGYATATVLVALPLALYVGGGAAGDCNTAGTNAGSASYHGGSGGDGNGANGADGVVSGGGTGNAASVGGGGGRGYFGGGGGGEGSALLIASGAGGGGGAATVFVVNGTRVAVAGGGGGGGGGAGFLGTGGAGGSGCAGNGQAGGADGGGGGGGGMCQGASSQAGSGTNPAEASAIPSGRARGGSASCGEGGAGYAIVTFSP